MNWIETVFHVDPDGGSGVVELCVLLGVIVCAAIASTRRHRRAARRPQR